MNPQPEVIFVERFVPDAHGLLRSILTQTKWDERLHARLTASFGAPYNYSNMTYPEVPMPSPLQEVCEAINGRLGFKPNNCLINNYVEGTSTMGFHADSIEELAPQTGVAIVSLGETRTLTFRRTQQREVRWECPLPQGSLLYMPPEVQLEWQHGVLKQAGAGQRLSLTFRALQ
ncbi:MAG: alpha-ketoglutarate-dependent dioxygenase AlkB [Armatimonadetes bacterium]|nr:alpha-ketoglutarate-dependent dioxygenase AlkB [Armatimonadota bacterium]